MRGLPDNNADAIEGTIPYIYIWIFVDLFEGERSSSRGGGFGVYSFEECIVFVQF